MILIISNIDTGWIELFSQDVSCTTLVLAHMLIIILILVHKASVNNMKLTSILYLCAAKLWRSLFVYSLSVSCYKAMESLRMVTGL